ncbi:MAG: hypothetical protein V2I67_20500 [Thermoanaerobaculales bacterium]|nr:hypothetical protein [Thermoanaerobaculales bacterium]
MVAIGTTGCAMGTSAVGASTYQKASIYRSAAATVDLGPEDAFEAAVKLLLERDDIEITELEEDANRCSARAGDQTLTLRIIEVGSERTRLSLLVGGGRDTESNQDLADEMIAEVCARLGSACD